MKPNKFYALEVVNRVADLVIYGDITSWPWKESDVSSYNLSKQLAELDVDEINVCINSYGGEVAEGLAIYNALLNHSAKINTRVDGFACSIASVIFMAGERRVMNDASMLMIHNAWTFARGNAQQLRKAADDAEKITNASVKAYMARVGISEEELRSMMDAETFLDSDEAVNMGFATEKTVIETEKPSQNARKAVMMRLINPYRQLDDPEKDPQDDEGTDTGDETPETDTNTDTDDKTPENDPQTGNDDPKTGDNDPDPDETDPEDDPEAEEAEENPEEDPENGEEDTQGKCGPDKDRKEKQMALFNAILNM